MNFYTIITEIENGGTYINQVSAIDHKQAMYAWISVLEKNNEIIELNNQDFFKINELLLSGDYNPLPIDNRINVWCTYFSIDSTNALINVIKTVCQYADILSWLNPKRSKYTAAGVGLALHGMSTAGFGIYNANRSGRELVDYFGKPNNRMGRGRPKMGNNRAKNEEVTSLVKKYKLDRQQQRKLHDYISGENLTRKEIEEIIKSKEYLR